MTDAMTDSDSDYRENSDPDEKDPILELSELAGALAHEIKNPLSVILMNMELLAEDFVEIRDQRDRRALDKIEVVRSQCLRLQNLLNDYLRFIRLRDLKLVPGNLNELIQRVLNFASVTTREKNIEVNPHLFADLPSIMMDGLRLYAALLNLVLNAIDAIQENGTLLLRTRLTSGGVAMDLIDDGCGMEQETLQRMFEPFYTNKESGSGLGLPTTRRIIEAHGGRIAVTSEVGQGTQFTLEFPMPARLTTGKDAQRPTSPQ